MLSNFLSIYFDDIIAIIQDTSLSILTVFINEYKKIYFVDWLINGVLF